jgi:hypothetical protein
VGFFIFINVLATDFPRTCRACSRASHSAARECARAGADICERLGAMGTVLSCRSPERIQLQPRRAAHRAHRFTPLGKRESRLHLDGVTAGVWTAWAWARGRAKGIVMRVGREPQEAKPLDHQRLGPSDVESLAGSYQPTGQGQPVHPQLLDMAM